MIVQASIALSYDFSTAQNHERGTDILQELHSLLNKIMPISPRLRSTIGTISSLKTLYETLRRKELYAKHHSIQILDELKAYETHAGGHLASVTLLEKKVQETVGLVSLTSRGKNRAHDGLTGFVVSRSSQSQESIHHSVDQS